MTFAAQLFNGAVGRSLKGIPDPAQVVLRAPGASIEEK